jgi:hypothetical protein
MATRPIGNPPIWSSIANYPPGVDPWSGNARSVPIPTGEAGGFTPETGIVAEYANAEFKVLSTWVEWLSFGSNAAGLDAHVVETDSAGVSAIAGLTAGGTAGAFPAITATANSGATGSVISATNNSGGFAILASSNGVLAAIRGVSTGVQPGIEGRNTGGGGPGISGTGDGAGSGVVGTGGTTGEGGTFTGGATSGDGAHGTGVGANFAGIRGLGPTVGGGYGVRGETQNPAGVGVTGFNILAGADPANAANGAVSGVGSDATGVFGISINGYGVWAGSDSTSPDRAALHVDPQNSEPNIALALSGDLYCNSVIDRFGVFEDSSWKVLHASRLGFVARNSAPVTGNEGGVGFSPLTNVQTFAPNAPAKAGNVLITVTGQFRNSDPTLHHFKLKLIDATAASDIETEEFYLSIAGATVAGISGDGYEESVCMRVEYLLPAAGNRSFEVEIEPVPSGGSGVEFRNVIVSVAGVY